MAKKRSYSTQPKEVQMTQETQIEQVQVLGEEEIVAEVTQGPVAEETTEATPVAQEAPQEPVKEVAEPAPVSKYSETLTRLLGMCQTTGNASLVNYVNELLDYADKMAPGRTMNQETGAANQAAFYTTLINLIDHTGKDFRIGFATLLAVFNEYKRATFSGAYALRFMEDVPLNKAKRDTFVKLVNLFNMTADAKTRKDVLKHIDLKRELIGLSEESKMRIVAFYTA